LPETIDRLSKRLPGLTADLATATEHAGDRITIGNRGVPREEVMAALGERLDALPPHVRDTHRFPLGVYRGLNFGLILHPQWSPEVFLEGEGTRQDVLSREHCGPRAILNALERLAGSYETQCAAVRRDLEIAQGQLRDYQGRLGKPFQQSKYLEQLAELRDQLRAGLSGRPPETQPSVSELAERIKALKAGHAIEPAPERTGKRRSSAEEPVTSRIRRRTEALPGSGPTIEPDAVTSSPGTAAAPESAAPTLIEQCATPVIPPRPASGIANSFTAPATRHQEEIARSRRRKERQPTLF
jgi:hypothetical protein